MSEILSQFQHEKHAGRAEIHLAQYYYFGETVMTKTTAGRLNPAKMAEIKDLILAKFRPNGCQADKEELWKRCKVAIGQKCKLFRSKAV